MPNVDMQDFREQLREVMDFVRFKNGRVTIVRRGRPIAQIIPVDGAGLRLPLTPKTEVARSGP